jgi:predicted 3-demethylubiquinone-9 3-methyltransferase (glyoxalase superfamily)
MTQTARAKPSAEHATVRSIVPCLTFKDQAEEAVNFYVSVFANSRITSLVRSDMDGPVPKGKVLNAAFELNGREYTAFDGGDHFKFSEAVSLVATCDTQQELDDVWHKLTSDGGEESQCGWLTDRFGVSWQIIPSSLQSMLAHPERGNVKAVLEAVWKMVKLDIAQLDRAYKRA